MKEIHSYNSKKYNIGDYHKCEDQIYKRNDEYTTSLSFQQEPDLREGSSAADISQYPLEDILDRFYVYVSDFYIELNTTESQTCHLEFASTDIEDIRSLREIIGKHVYNKTIYECGEERVTLIIE